VDGHHPADGPHADLRAPLLHEGGVDAERAELGILLGAADEVHRGEVHLAHAPGPAGRSVFEPGFALLDPAAQHPVDVRPALGIIPGAYQKRIDAAESEAEVVRSIADVISSMTERQLLVTHKKLSGIELGSITDLL